MQQADRHNDGKLKWSLVPQSALEPMVRVMEYGAEKYAPHNYMRGLHITTICESLKRHLDAFMEGEDDDPESKLSHIGHIQANALFLSWMMKHRPDMDDRGYDLNSVPEAKKEYSLEDLFKSYAQKLIKSVQFNSWFNATK